MKKYIAGGIGMAVIVIAAVWFISRKEPEPITTDSSKISILVPQNIDTYKSNIDACAGEQACQDTAVNESLFIKKELTIAYTEDVIKASALAAANVIPTQGGTLSIAYWKIQDDTAYVLLNIHLDGWAGVSLSLAKIEPIIEKSLLQFSQIKYVAFKYAPGDSQ
jgi:hypothetical protein